MHLAAVFSGMRTRVLENMRIVLHERLTVWHGSDHGHSCNLRAKINDDGRRK